MSADIREQYDKIYRYCYFKVKNAVLAEDLTQETFLKYFSQNSYIDRGRSMAYLYTIARHLCVDSFRGKVCEELPEDLPGKNSLDGLEQSLDVRKALDQLSEEQQELLLLRYVNELSVKELAVLFGISRFAVYRKIKAALGALKTLLREEDLHETY